MKLAFIVQRYGRDILGGAETLARQIAERLSRRHEITVLTTTAKDYVTWKNEYSEGEDKFRGVRILRFLVESERNLDEFNKLSETIYSGEPSQEQQLEWIEQQGPVVPALVEHLKNEHHKYDLLVFFTYLYYPTYYGLSVAPEKSILVPTAHDEPPLKLPIYKEMFLLPSGFIFNTEAEELLVLERFPVHKRMRETIGLGMELLDQPDFRSFQRQRKLSNRYLLYAGRIDGGKGVDELLRFFRFYKEENPASGNLQLIFIGQLAIKRPVAGDIHYLGFVSESEKLAAMAGALAVVQSSRMESLSIVTLESFAVGTPVVVHGGSKVLVDHCRRANAGFYYRDFEEFEEILTLLLSNRSMGRTLGKNGERYVKDNYGWQKLLPKYELAFRSMARSSRVASSGTTGRELTYHTNKQGQGTEKPQLDKDISASPEIDKSDDGNELMQKEVITVQPTVESSVAAELTVNDESAVVEGDSVSEAVINSSSTGDDKPLDSDEADGLPSFYRGSAKNVDELTPVSDNTVVSTKSSTASTLTSPSPLISQETENEEGLSFNGSAPLSNQEAEAESVSTTELEMSNLSEAKLPSFYRSTVEPRVDRAETSPIRDHDIKIVSTKARDKQKVEMQDPSSVSKPESQRDEAVEKDALKSENPVAESGLDDDV